MADARKDPIDSRQRFAAALLLSAVQPAVSLADHAEQLRQVAEVCPGYPAGSLHLGDRLAALRQARGLVDTLISDLLKVQGLPQENAGGERGRA